MFANFLRLTALVLLLALVPGAPLMAQGEGPPPTMPQQPQMPDSVRELMTEFQEIQRTLDSIQTQAVEANPELRAQQAQLQETVQEKMIEMHPDLEPKMDRMETLQGEIQQAQQSQNQQKVQQLISEARGIQQEIQTAQADALEEEEVSEAVDSFRDNLVDAMSEVDPEVEEKLDRMDELAQRIRNIQMGGGPGGGR